MNNFDVNTLLQPLGFNIGYESNYEKTYINMC